MSMFNFVFWQIFVCAGIIGKDMTFCHFLDSTGADSSKPFLALFFFVIFCGPSQNFRLTPSTISVSPHFLRTFVVVNNNMPDMTFFVTIRLKGLGSCETLSALFWQDEPIFLSRPLLCLLRPIFSGLSETGIHVCPQILLVYRIINLICLIEILSLFFIVKIYCVCTLECLLCCLGIFFNGLLMRFFKSFFIVSLYS